MGGGGEVEDVMWRWVWRWVWRWAWRWEYIAGGAAVDT